MKIIAIILAAVSLPAVLLADMSEWYSVCLVTDNFRESHYQVMTNEQYNQFTKELWNRNRVLTQAIRLASDEWKKGEETKDKVFPVNITGKAQAKRVKTFPDKEKAEAHAKELEEEAAKNANASKPKSYLEKKAEVLEDEIERALTLPMTSQRKKFIEDRKKEIVVLREELGKRRQKEREIEAQKSQAKDLIKSHIDTLVKEVGAPSYETPKLMLIWLE